VRPGQPADVAQEFDEQQPRLDFVPAGNAVNPNRYWQFHGLCLVARQWWGSWN
jgi:hypothetical protein